MEENPRKSRTNGNGCCLSILFFIIIFKDSCEEWERERERERENNDTPEESKIMKIQTIVAVDNNV